METGAVKKMVVDIYQFTYSTWIHCNRGRLDGNRGRQATMDHLQYYEDQRRDNVNAGIEIFFLCGDDHLFTAYDIADLPHSKTDRKRKRNYRTANKNE